jgi:hypothetical protein
MPAKEIKELRQAGKLDDAYSMAFEELEADPTNIWGKRNLSWVLYAQLDLSCKELDLFLTKITEVKELELPATEEMFYDNLSIVISRAARHRSSGQTVDQDGLVRLYDAIRNLPLKRKTKWFSLLFGAFQKGLKETNRYIDFADWWDFDNFLEDDFQKAIYPDGKEVMSIVEQAYINYSKHLLPKQNSIGQIEFNRAKAEEFLPRLNKIVEEYPLFQYPAYFQAKLLLALGDKENILSSLLPFAKKKRNDFWVWEILADAYSSDLETVFACYCRALSCKAPQVMLVSLRQKMARKLIERGCYNEARTEIDIVVGVRNTNGFKIPYEILDWVKTDWYNSSVPRNSNIDYYKQYNGKADALLWSDVQEYMVFVEFVNKDKKILNFLKSEDESGFFKYDRFIDDVHIGDVLSVRFQDGGNDGHYKVLTASKVENAQFKSKFYREIGGQVKIPENKSFGFLEDVFLHPSIVKKYALIDGAYFSGIAIKSYNKEKKQWGWKMT